LGLVYKLVEIETLPKHKLSAEVEKSTLPGKKAVSRVWLEDSFAKLDLISQETE
jgi:nicotinate phosphoribosyltransferase